MDWTLEVVCVPVSDVDRATEFYAERMGFALDHDTAVVYDRDGTLRPARDDDALNNVGFAFFADPDGNTWSLQQIDARA